MGGIDTAAELFGMRLREQHVERDLDDIGIAVDGDEIVIGKFLCLDQKVPVFRTARAERSERR
jgi:hypothetical protein